MPGDGSPAGPGRALIAAAVPKGSRRLRGRWIERAYVDAWTADPRLAGLRPIARINQLEWAKWMARHARWADGTTRPVRDRVCQLARFCETTFKACRRRAEAWGYSGTVVEGTTAEFTPMALDKDAPNTAAVYVLCVPRGHPAPQVRPQMRPPTRSRRDRGCAYTQESALWKTGRSGDGPACGRTVSRAAAAPSGAAPAADVVAVLRAAAGYPIGEAWCQRLSAAFTARGYTAADLAFAIDHERGGAQHRFVTAVRHPAGRIRWRLRQWRDEHGIPVLSRSQQLAVSRQAARADAAATRQLAGDRPGQLRQALDAAAAVVAATRKETRTVRWIQYANESFRRARCGGRPRQGTWMQAGPVPGTVWAIVEDEPLDRLFILVHHYPDAPENNYELETEQR
jgi:hypothetical protein